MVQLNRQDREARIYICGVEPEDELLTEDQTMFLFCDAEANIITDIIDKSVEQDARHCVEQLNRQGKIAAALYTEIVPGESVTFAVEVDGNLVMALAQIHRLALETGVIHDELKEYPAQIIKLGESKLKELRKEYEQNSSIISETPVPEEKVTVDELISEIENTTEAAISPDIPETTEPEAEATVDELVSEIENTAEAAISPDIPETPEPEVEATVDELVNRIEPVASVDTSTARDHRRLALNHRLKDEWDDAIVEYTKAIELDSDYVLAYFERGELYQRQGRKADAIADFEKSMSLSQKEDLTVAAKRHISELSKQS
jgi:tetratricopeptide (TPR) repeat protein